MPDIILLDGRGEPATYSDVSIVEFDTVDGDRAQFHNLKFSEVDVDLDFSATEQMQVEPAEGEVYQKVHINKPEGLIPENILAGVSIAGVDGELELGGGGDELIDGSAVSINSGATSVTQYALYERKNITSVSLPCAETIGASAFSGCSALTEVNVPVAKTIGASAFSGCSGLTELSFPNVTALDKDALINCTSLTDLHIPKLSDKGSQQGLTSLQNVFLGDKTTSTANLFVSPPFNNAYTVPVSALRQWQTSYGNTTTPFKQYSDTNVTRYACNDANAASVSMSFYAEAGETIVAVIASRKALTIPSGWTLLRENPAHGDQSQRLSFAYTTVTETGTKTYTFSQASSARIYVNLIALKNVKSLSYPGGYYRELVAYVDNTRIFTKSPDKKLIWGASSTYWEPVSAVYFWETNPQDITVVQKYNNGQARACAFLDFGTTTERTISAAVDKSGNFPADSDIQGQIDAIEIEFYEEE